MIFYEEQKISRKYLYIVFIIPVIILSTLVIDFRPYAIIAALVILSIAIAVLYFLFSLRLIIKIESDCIYIRIKNFQRKPEKIFFTDVQQISIEIIKPFSDFGGIGLRHTKNGTGYIFEGSQALYIKKKGGRVFVITIKNREGFLKAVASVYPELMHTVLNK